jgi:hypothetical protein
MKDKTLKTVLSVMEEKWPVELPEPDSTESAWDEYVKITFAYAFQMDSREAIAIPGGEEYKKRIIDGRDKALREWFRKYESEIKNIPIKEK